MTLAFSRIPALLGLHAIANLIGCLAIGLLLAACDGPVQREAAHLERGKAFLEEGNRVKARLEFRNVLQINPLNVESRYYLALVEEADGNMRGAFANFRKATQQQPDHLPSLIKVGQYYLFANQLDQAGEMAQAILASSPDNADGHALLGAIHLRDQKLDLARREIDLALHSDPSNLAAVSALVGIQRQVGDIESAFNTLDAALGRAPSATGLLQLKVQLLIERNALPQAEEVYRKLVALAPDSLAHKSNLAKLLIKQDRKDDAESYLRSLVGSEPEQNKAKLLLVDFLLNQRGFQPAQEALLEFISGEPEDLRLRFSLAELYLKNEDPQTALEIYQQIVGLDERGPNGLTARSAMAQLHLAQGNPNRSHELVAQVLEADPRSTEALFLRARFRLQQGDNEGAIADLRTLLRDRPDLKDGRALLAEAHLRNSEPTLAIEALRVLLEFGPENQAVRVELARQLARQGESETALEMLAETLAKVPDDLAALRVQAEVFSRQKNWGALIDTATRMIEQTSVKALGHHIRGQAFLTQNNFAEAAADFLQVIALEPESLEPLVGLVRSYLGQNIEIAAETLVLERLRATPENGALHNLLGELYRAKGQDEEAANAFRQAILHSPDWAIAHVNLGGLSMAAGDPDAAIATYRTGLRAAPKNQQLSFALATALIVRQDYAAASDVYEAMLEENPNQPVVANNLAALIADFQFADKDRLQRALKLAAAFDKSDDPLYLDTLGWVHYRLGDTQQALAYLEQAVGRAPGLAQLQYHLGMAYVAAEEAEKARRALRLALADNTSFIGRQIAKATLGQL